MNKRDFATGFITGIAVIGGFFTVVLAVFLIF
jgi:hypothetical protein